MSMLHNFKCAVPFHVATTTENAPMHRAMQVYIVNYGNNLSTTECLQT